MTKGRAIYLIMTFVAMLTWMSEWISPTPEYFTPSLLFVIAIICATIEEIGDQISTFIKKNIKRLTRRLYD